MKIVMLTYSDYLLKDINKMRASLESGNLNPDQQFHTRHHLKYLEYQLHIKDRYKLVDRSCDLVGLEVNLPENDF